MNAFLPLALSMHARAVSVQTLAEQFFPNEDPVGRRLQHFLGESTIIGVVGRVDHDEIGDAPKAVAYYSFGHATFIISRTIVVRSAAPVSSVTDMIRRTVDELDKNVPIYDVQRMASRIEQSLGPRRLTMLVLGGFATLVLVLASFGIYGVMRYTTARRTQEIGIRMAIGANGRDVVRMILQQGMTVAAAGVAFGLLAALALTRFMSGVLYGVSPHDAAAFVTDTLILVAVAFVATRLPAHRATRIGPMQALRND